MRGFPGTHIFLQPGDLGVRMEGFCDPPGWFQLERVKCNLTKNKCRKKTIPPKLRMQTKTIEAFTPNGS